MNKDSKNKECLNGGGSPALRVGAVMPRFSKQDVIECLKKRDKDAFDNPYQKYEHREINAAIDIIERLMPPSYFPNGA